MSPRPSDPAPGIPELLTQRLGQKKIPRLDALRAISAAIVVIYHSGFDFFPAGLGVMIFFVISGFLITWLLLDEFQKTGGVGLGRFYFRRTFRIFPAFYVFWIVTVGALAATHRHVLWGQAIAALLYVSNYYQGLHHYPESALSHTWSLGVEEQYYLVWPALFAVLTRKRQDLLLPVCCGIILLIWVYRGILTIAGAPEYYIYTAFETRIDHILVGCALAISLYYGRFARLYQAICARTIYIAWTAGGLLLSTTAAWIWGTGYRDTIGFMVDPVLAALLMAQLIASRSRWVEWMDCRVLVYLGTISYSTYLYHKFAASLLTRVTGPLPVIFGLPLALAATYAMAAISYHGVERPFLRLRDVIQSRWKDRARAREAALEA